MSQDEARSRIAELEDGIRMADSALDGSSFPETLLVEHGAISKFAGGTYVFRWFSVSASSTAGRAMSIRAWMRAARRKINQLEATP